MKSSARFYRVRQSFLALANARRMCVCGNRRRIPLRSQRTWKRLSRSRPLGTKADLRGCQNPLAHPRAISVLQPGRDRV